MKEESTYRSPALKTFIFSAIILVILFWIFETALEVYVFHLGDNFLRHIFFPSFHELWMRLIVASLTAVAVGLVYHLLRHRQMENALKQSEEKFRSLFNQASDSIFLMRPTDNNLIIEDANKVACNIHGYTREELIGNSIGMLDDPETRKHIPERLPLLMSGKPINVEAMHVRKDGSTFPIEIAAQRIQIGENPYILAIDRDITKRKKAEAALQESEGRFKAILSAMPDLMFRISKDGEHLDYFAPSANQLLVKPETFLGRRVNEVLPQEVSKKYMKHIHQALETGKMQIFEYELTFPQGMRNYESRLVVNRKDETLAIVRDITGQKKAKKDLLAATKKIDDERAKLDAVINGLGIGLIIQDLNYKVIYENEFQQNTIGNHVGEYCHRAYEGKEQICEDCPMVLSLQDGKIHKTEKIVLTEEGEFYYELTTSPLKDSEGNIIGGIKAVQEMTESRRAEKAVMQSKELLTTIMDSIDSLVYVADMETYEILFINKYGRDVWGDITGKICWQEIQSGQTGPCNFCTNKYLIDPEGKPTGVHTWEFQNTINKHWYYINDRAIPWTDGHLVRMEIATDITDRKETEAELNERMKLAELSADVGIAFTTGVTLQDALQKCSLSLVDHLDALFVRIWLFNEKEDILELKASAGLYTHLDGPHSRIPYGKYKIGNIAKNRKPHLTNDVANDPHVNDQEWVMQEKIVSFAGHPLLLKDRLIGVMAMFSRSVFSEIAMKALSLIADQISIGIDQKLKEEQVLLAKEQWETTFDTIPDIVIVIDRNHRIIRANNALADRLGVDRDDIVGKPCYTVVHGTSEPPAFCPHVAVLADGKERVEEIFDEHLNGYFQFSATPILDSKGNVTATVHVARDITKRKQMEEKLKEAAITDELTGLLNRRGFFALAEQQCKLSERTKRSMSLLYIDLDGLKTINDELGHSAGDQALIDLTGILKNTFRGSDIVARMGGDEFAVLLTEPAESAESAVTDHLHNNIRKHNEKTKRNFELLISLGISYYDPLSPCSIEHLIMEADSSMYKDKKSHKESDRVFVKKKPERER
jgi:diguanylate cyclase (GGDEF)-like protein/PAS domain S-box-containing protein